MPSIECEKVLREDYRMMRPMFFHAPPVTEIENTAIISGWKTANAEVWQGGFGAGRAGGTARRKFFCGVSGVVELLQELALKCARGTEC